MNENTLRPKILHIGYFGEYNCGDDAFVNVFEYLNKTYYPHYECHYKKNINKIDLSEYKIITLGGGDVISDYFLNSIKKNYNIHAVGVGVPYESEINKISLFKSVILRNSRDYENAKLLLPDLKIMTFPDLVFLFSKMYPKIDKFIKTSSTKMKIGFCLTRTYYHRSYETEYTSFVIAITKIIRNLLEMNYQIYLIPFCINSNKIKENDCLLTHQIKKFFVNNDDVIDACKLPEYNKKYYVKQTYMILNSMDFNVCSRFHAHIFSTVLRKPFVSLSCSRKCREYMKENRLDDNFYQLDVNEIDIPINLNVEQITKFIINKIENREIIVKQLETIMKEIDMKIDNFIDYWSHFINQNK